MGITKDFLKEQMIRLETNYGRERFVITKEIFNLWLERLKDCDANGLKLAFDKCIDEREYPPNIAVIKNIYQELDAERNELADTIRSQYTTMRSVWGESYDKETFNEIVKYIMRQPRSMRKVEMIELQQRAVSFAHDCEGCGRRDKPTIKEYVQGKR